MPLPLIPILVYGGAAGLIGGGTWGIFKGAQASTQTLLTVAAVGGTAYYLYKKA